MKLLSTLANQVGGIGSAQEGKKGGDGHRGLHGG